MLCTIRDDTHYYSLDESACLHCGGNDLNPLWVGLGVLVTLPGLVTLGWCCRKRVPRRLQALFRSAWGIYDSLSIRGKVKQALSFCVSSPFERGTHQPEDWLIQLSPPVRSSGDARRRGTRATATGRGAADARVDRSLPEPNAVINIASQVQQLLGMFDFVNINIASFGMPLQCLGLGNFEDHLAFTMFAPVVLAAAILLGFLSLPYLAAIRALDRRWFRRGKPKESLLAALPWLLILTFLVAPMVSSSAFRAFSCEDFDNGYTHKAYPTQPCTLLCTLPMFLLFRRLSYLRADFAIECSNTEAGSSYSRVELLAWLGILLYPVGRPVG